MKRYSAGPFFASNFNPNCSIAVKMDGASTGSVGLAAPTIGLAYVKWKSNRPGSPVSLITGRSNPNEIRFLKSSRLIASWSNVQIGPVIVLTLLQRFSPGLTGSGGSVQVPSLNGFSFGPPL